jgi:hypothetical protein
MDVLCTIARFMNRQQTHHNATSPPRNPHLSLPIRIGDVCLYLRDRQRIFRWGIQVRESAPYFSRPTPDCPAIRELIYANTPCLGILTSANLFIHCSNLSGTEPPSEGHHFPYVVRIEAFEDAINCIENQSSVCTDECQTKGKGGWYIGTIAHSGFGPPHHFVSRGACAGRGNRGTQADTG